MNAIFSIFIKIQNKQQTQLIIIKIKTKQINTRIFSYLKTKNGTFLKKKEL